MKNYKQNKTKRILAKYCRFEFFFFFFFFWVVSKIFGNSVWCCFARMTIYGMKGMQMMCGNAFTSVYAWHIASYND